MNILYSAIDQTVPGAHGGAVHVESVAEGLAALGHQVDVLVTPGLGPFPAGRARWHGVRPPGGLRQLRLLRAREVVRIARALRPEVVIERYYNFGGEGVVAARRIGAMAVLEVNAPVIDYPGSRKRLLDRALLIEPMRRWRDWQCRAARLIVTPSAKILPPFVRPEQVVQVEWGADTKQFHPRAQGPVPFARGPADIIVIFVGAFRAWHGAIQLIDAIKKLRARGRSDIKAVLIGDGPELPRVRAAAAGIEGVVLTGALPHERIPACLAAADIGVAPFDIAAHAPLAQEFHWSPLKVFEYMASGLPVVVPRIPRLAHVIRDGQEGALYDPADPMGLALAIERLAAGDAARTMGASARVRAIQQFGWQHHCELLDDAITSALRACAS